MNYEQKYNEALDAARHIYDDMKSGGNFGGMEDLEVIFPELVESEDERIRKAIGAAICGAMAKSILEANGTNLPDALAYLEKQKEQKPVEWSEEEMKYINTCLLILNRPFHDMSDEERAAYNWLKSLRPSWKPSEEQMGAIRTAIDVLRGQVYDGKELYPGTSHVLTMMLNYFQANNNDTKV